MNIWHVQRYSHFNHVFLNFHVLHQLQDENFVHICKYVKNRETMTWWCQWEGTWRLCNAPSLYYTSSCIYRPKTLHTYILNYIHMKLPISYRFFANALPWLLSFWGSFLQLETAAALELRDRLVMFQQISLEWPGIPQISAAEDMESLHSLGMTVD